MVVVFFISHAKMNPDTKPERPRPKILTIEPKKILIKGKQRKIFECLDILLLPKKDNQKDTSTGKVN